MVKKEKFIPEVITNLRKDYVRVPDNIKDASGIRINGKRFKSFLFTTDISVLMNNNADACLAVYPFSPHPAIIEAMTASSTMPIFAGVGGGTTQGGRSANMALFAEAHGCSGVVVNSPTPIETIRIINEVVDIPIIMTVVSPYVDIKERLEAGIDILNVSGASETSTIVKVIRENHPTIPIIATGGPTAHSIQETIAAGANAITVTPPTNGKLFSEKMKKYRKIEKEDYYQEN